MKKPRKSATKTEPPIQLYKVLTADGHSPYIVAYAWSLPTKNADGTWTPGAWHEEPPTVLDIGHGLHITPCPMDYWPRLDSVAYECEAEGYREDPATGSHVVALKVRLLRPITRDAAQEVSQEWKAGRWARQSRARQKEHLDAARKVAAQAKADREAARKLGVDSPALASFRYLDAVTPTESWRDVNEARHAALRYATAYLRFDPDDVKTIVKEFRGSYWLGEGGAEHLYGLAVIAKNASACASWEAYLGRKPWWRTSQGERTRLSVGDSLMWDGLLVDVTSIDDAADVFVACAYTHSRKVVGRGGDAYVEHTKKIARRFRVTREAFNAVFNPKPARAARSARAKVAA